MQERASPSVDSPGPRAEVSLDPDGILTIDFRHCERVTLAIVEAAHARHLELSREPKRPVLMLGHHVAGIDYAAQRFGSTPSVNNVVLALGLVVRSFLERHLARMFLMYHRPPYPVRVFENEVMARNWLRAFLEQSPADQP